MRLGDGQRAHPKPPRWGCCRASRIAAPPGWQQGKKKNPSVSALNLQQLHVCKGGGVQSLPGSPRPRSRAVNLFQGWERNSWKAETSCWDLGALLGAFARDSHHRAAPASFPSLNKQHNRNVHVSRKKPHLITLCLQNRAAGTPAAHCAPAATTCNFNRLSLKKSRKVLPLQKQNSLGAYRNGSSLSLLALPKAWLG